MVDYSFPDVINISIHFIMKLKKKYRKKKQSGRHEICRLQRMLQKRYGEYNQAIPDFFFLRVIFNAFMSLNDGWEDWRS